MTFNRYYVSYPLCCPSRVSLLTGRYAHNNGVKGNVQPNGGYSGFSFRGAYTHNLATWLQGAGYRTIHVGKFLNGYGDEPYDNGTTVPPGWSAWHTVLKADTDHYLLRLLAQQQRHDRRPLRRLRHLGTARIRRPRRHRLPLRPAQRPALLLRDRHADQLRDRRSCAKPRPNSPSTCSSTTPPRTATSASPAGPEPAPRHYDWFKGAPLPHNRGRRLRRGQRHRQAELHPRSAVPLAQRDPHLPRLLRQGARVAARDRRRGQTADRHAGLAAPPAQHLRHLHLRQRLLLRRAPPDRRQVPRLRALHPPPLPDPRPAHPGRHRIRRAGRQHRHRADHARTGRRRSRQEHRRALDDALPARPRTAHPAPAPLRVLRRNLRRRRKRRDRRTGRPEPRDRTPARGGQRPARAAKPTPRSWRRPRTTRESASAPTSTSPGRTARRSSTTSKRTPTSSTTSSASPTTSRSATSSTAN